MNAFFTQAAKASNAPSAIAPVAPAMDNEIDVLARHWQEAKEAEAAAKTAAYKSKAKSLNW